MGIQELLQEARELESREKYKDAAIIYQKVFDRDQGDTLVAARLLIIYRKLKEYLKELAVIDDALANFRQREKAIQQKWIKDHPKAAGIGRSMLRQMEKGGDEASALGADPKVGVWLKRRALITRKIKGYKEPAGKRKKVTMPMSSAEQTNKTPFSSPKKTQRQNPPAQKSHPVKVNEPRQAPIRDIHPSLFIISLTYWVQLEKIDAAMPGHIAYLHRHYKKGDFLVSGRKVPRTGGIIIARGADRMTIEKIVKEDPFVKKGLAGVDIMEFSASQVGKNSNLGIKKG